MQDRPDAAELASAIAGFLREELLPGVLDGRLRFRLRVAINGLTMLEREARCGRSQLSAGNAAIAHAFGLVPGTEDPALLAGELHAELARRIRDGQAPDELLPLLRRLVELKLEVASPATLARYGRIGQKGIGS